MSGPVVTVSAHAGVDAAIVLAAAAHGGELLVVAEAHDPGRARSSERSAGVSAAR
jgi:hypothetical protein